MVVRKPTYKKHGGCTFFLSKSWLLRVNFWGRICSTFFLCETTGSFSRISILFLPNVSGENKLYMMWKILLMEEILHHLECINLVDSGIHTYQLVQDFFHQQYESGFCPINTFFFNGRDSGFWSEPEKVFLLQIFYTTWNQTWFTKKSPNCKGTSSEPSTSRFSGTQPFIFPGCTTILPSVCVALARYPGGGFFTLPLIQCTTSQDHRQPQSDESYWVGCSYLEDRDPGVVQNHDL